MVSKNLMLLFLFLCSFIVSAVYSQESTATSGSTIPALSLSDSTSTRSISASPESPANSLPISDSLVAPVLDFKNADVGDVLRALGLQYSINIFLDPDVTGTISLYLTNIKVKDAIDFIVKRSNCVYVVEKGIVKVRKYKEPLPSLPPKPTIEFHLKNGLLDVNIIDLPARQVAALFIDSLGMNVVVDGQTTKNITARIKAVPPEKAIKIIFETNDYSVTVSDGIYYVSRATWGDDAQNPTGKGGPKKLSTTVYEDKKISIEVDNAALDNVVRTIALQAGINTIIYETISGNISARLDSVDLDDVLRFILQNTKFTFWKDKNIYFIGSRDMSQQKTTVLIPLKHIMAEEATISKILPPNLTTNAVIKYNGEHNAVIVIGSFDVVAAAEEFFEKIDKPIPQVLIEALVIDFNVNKVRELGFSLFTQGQGDSSANWNSEKFLPELDLKPGREKIIRNLQSVLNFTHIGGIVSLPANFRASIQAMESAAIVKVHSTPQIATINGNPASITIGETRYYKLTKEYQTPVSTNSSTVIGTDQRFETIKFNTKLDVTPWVMDEGYVMVKIHPEFNIPRSGGSSDVPPTVDTRVLESMVRLRDGQTIVLGGQRQTEEVVSRRGIPFLSSIPVLGWLFSSRTVTQAETQMMIFLTPHVYYGDDNRVSPDTYFGDEVRKIIGKKELEQMTRDTKGLSILGTPKNDSLSNNAHGVKPKPKTKKRIKWPWRKD